MKKMKKKIILLILTFIIGLNNIYAKEKVKFVDCVDGDTIKISLDNKEYTVRMLAVDTPESVHPSKPVEYYAKEASEYTCNRAKNAKKIEVEYDEDSEKMDKYDRLLVWVFIDGTLHQKDLIEKGYAKVAYLYGDYKYTKELESAQELASANNVGIWNEEEKKSYNEKNNINEDVKEKEKTENNTKTTKAITNLEDYSTKDIIIIGVLLIIIVFVGDKTIKNKAKKKLKKYLK